MRRAIGLVVALVLSTGVAVAAERRPVHEVTPSSIFEVARDIPDSARFDQEIADGNEIAMTITNYGFYGNNFYKASASFEYPAKTEPGGYEHMVRGGLWIGARATNAYGEFIGVTCGTVDASAGPNSTEASEWTPSGMDILKRSVLPTSLYYDSLRAVSELDFVCEFNDSSPAQVAGSERHTPMGLEVRHETYQWNFAEFANVLFVHLKVTNRGPLLKDVWVGFITELASGCKKCYPNWPSTGGSPLGGWFDKKWIVFDESLHLLREHYCAGQPLPPGAGCNLDVAPYWAGLRYLGSHGLASEDTVTVTRKLSFSAWNWAPGSPLRDEDWERYALMNTGLIQSTEGDSLNPGTGDPVEVFSVGPFPRVYRDSSITVDFAFVGGSGGAGGGDPLDIQLNSKFAQFAYDNDYILPTPPPSPRFRVVAREQALDFYWDNESQKAYDRTSKPPQDFQGYRVYIGDSPRNMAMVAQFDVAGDTASFNTGFGTIALDPPVPVDGLQALYKFTVNGLRDGFKYYCAVTAFDLGNNQIRSLESARTQNQRIGVPGPQPGERPDSKPTVYPNPYRVEARWDQGKGIREHWLTFDNLPKRCTIRIFTLAGDLLFVKEFEGNTNDVDDARGMYNRSASLGGKPTLSGHQWPWDMITRQGQAIATGLYLYSVEDHASGNQRHVGKFLVVKSDREGQ